MVQVKGVKGPSGEFGAVGVVEVAGSAADVWRFVADVERQPQWNRGVKQSRVVERRGPNRKSVHQVLQWSFLALRGDMHLRLDQREDPRALTISTEMTDGTMMRQFRSRVGVRDKAPGVCELRMEMFVAPSIPVPFGIRAMVGGQVRRQLRGVLGSLQDCLEARQRRADEAAAAAPPPWQWQWRGPGAWLAQGGRGSVAQPPWWMAIDLVAAA